MVDTLQLHGRLAARAEDFVRDLFGDRARCIGPDKWRVGAKGSLSIEVKRERVVYFDNEAGAGGDGIELWQRERGGTNGEALRAVAGWCGLAENAPSAAQSPLKVREPSKRALQIPPPIPKASALAWSEGRRWLGNAKSGFRAEVVRELAAWRGWPVEYVCTLISAGILSAPLYCGHRTRAAFPIWLPLVKEEFPNRTFQRFVGYHVRLAANVKTGGWRFAPHCRKDVHPGLPSLPLILAGSGVGANLGAAKLLIICEGEWDALSVVLAAGWFDAARGALCIPPAVAVCGILGAGAGANALLDYYAPFWPPELDAVVLRDSDSAGDRWKEPRGFLHSLRARCRSVESLHLGAGECGKRRDVNDLWRAGRFNRHLLDAIMACAGWKLQDVEQALPNRKDAPPPDEHSEGARISDELEH